jgi:hypothetical protein
MLSRRLLLAAHSVLGTQWIYMVCSLSYIRRWLCNCE